jgi:N utilization substance protein A
MRGTRVKNIVRELHGEKIDIIRWHDDLNEYLAAALAPAKIAEIHADESRRHALVVVDDDQLSLAIGKKGQNVRLASKLTGWQLEIKSRSQLAEQAVQLSQVTGVDAHLEDRLKQAGIGTAAQLASATPEQLRVVEGLSTDAAVSVIEAAKQAVEAARLAVQPAHVEPHGGTDAAPADAPTADAPPAEPAPDATTDSPTS